MDLEMDAMRASMAATRATIVLVVSSVARLQSLNGDIAASDTVSRLYPDVVETTSGGLRLPRGVRLGVELRDVWVVF
jgi:hypothetical protein